MKVSREWREMLQGALWERCDVAGYRPYRKLDKLMHDKRELSTLPMIRTITLREGFAHASDMYNILSHPKLTSLEEISILPDWPIPFHQMVDPISPFEFGLQLVRAKKPLKSLTYGLPIEMTTNEASRQQLRTLAVPSLYLSFARPTLSIFQEIETLVHECTHTLGIRYVTNRITIEPSLLLSEPLQSFEKVIITLQLPRPSRSLVTPLGIHFEDDPASPTRGFLSRLKTALENADEDMQARYTVYNIEGWEATNNIKEKTRIWPIMEAYVEPEVIVMEEGPTATEKGQETGRSTVSPQAGPSEPKRNNQKSQWERQTNLKLLGGLIGLSLESKKY